MQPIRLIDPDILATVGEVVEARVDGIIRGPDHPVAVGEFHGPEPVRVRIGIARELLQDALMAFHQGRLVRGRNQDGQDPGGVAIHLLDHDIRGPRPVGIDRRHAGGRARLAPPTVRRNVDVNSYRIVARIDAGHAADQRFGAAVRRHGSQLDHRPVVGRDTGERRGWRACHQKQGNHEYTDGKCDSSILMMEILRIHGDSFR